MPAQSVAAVLKTIALNTGMLYDAAEGFPADIASAVDAVNLAIGEICREAPFNEITQLSATCGTLVAGQNEYGLNTWTAPDGVTAYALVLTTLEKVIGVDIKDSNGDWQPLSPVELRGSKNWRRDFTTSTATGTPSEYAIEGNNIVLFPAPDTTATNSLRVRYTGPFADITLSGTTFNNVLPGPPEVWDVIATRASIILLSALPAEARDNQRLSALASQYPQALQKAIRNQRWKGERPEMRVRAYVHPLDRIGRYR